MDLSPEAGRYREMDDVHRSDDHSMPTYGNRMATIQASAPYRFAIEIMKGFAQVVFCDSAVTGLFVLVGMIVADREAAAYSFIGVFAATLYASFRSNKIDLNGLCGFNAQLVGMAISIFSSGIEGSSIQMFVVRPIVVVLLSILSVPIAQSMNKLLGNGDLELPSLTLPFNICAIAFLGGVVSYPAFQLSSTWHAHLPDPETDHEDVQSCLRDSVDGLCSTGFDFVRDFAIAVLHGVSEIFICSDYVTGILIVVGIAAHSFRLAMWAVIGSVIGLGYALALEMEGYRAYSGLFGYNPSLACMAIGSGLFVEISTTTNILAALTGLLTSAIHASATNVMGTFALPCFTLPFCVGVLLLLPSRRRVRRASKTDSFSGTGNEAKAMDLEDSRLSVEEETKTTADSMWVF